LSARGACKSSSSSRISHKTTRACRKKAISSTHLAVRRRGLKRNHVIRVHLLYHKVAIWRDNFRNKTVLRKYTRADRRYALQQDVTIIAHNTYLIIYRCYSLHNIRRYNIWRFHSMYIVHIYYMVLYCRSSIGNIFAKRCYSDVKSIRDEEHGSLFIVTPSHSCWRANGSLDDRNNIAIHFFFFFLKHILMARTPQP